MFLIIVSILSFFGFGVCPLIWVLSTLFCITLGLEGRFCTAVSALTVSVKLLVVVYQSVGFLSLVLACFALFLFCPFVHLVKVCFTTFPLCTGSCSSNRPIY